MNKVKGSDSYGAYLSYSPLLTLVFPQGKPSNTKTISIIASSNK